MKQSTAPSAARIIYDLGANNGDDVAYYLRKADKVVAIEANPDLAAHLRTRFAAEIVAGRVVVEHCALTDDPEISEIPFFIHRTQNGLSQLLHPGDSRIAEFRLAQVPASTAPALVRRHGPPHYIKIDLEGYDHVVLRTLFEAGLKPPYISAEAHGVEVFCTLVALGGYRAFKMVRGQFLRELYAQCRIATDDGPAPFNFDPVTSSGPFGEDLKGDWMDPVIFQRYHAQVGTGWVDVHASRIDSPVVCRIRVIAEIAASLAYQIGMRLGSWRLMRWSLRLWRAV